MSRRRIVAAGAATAALFVGGIAATQVDLGGSPESADSAALAASEGTATFTFTNTGTATYPIPAPVTVTETAPPATTAPPVTTAPPPPTEPPPPPVTTSPSPPPPPPATSDLFVSATGVDTAACTQAAPCRSFNRAYQRAKCGDLVSIAAGTYPSQTIDSPEKDCSSYVTFAPASGTVVTQTVTVRSGDWIRFKGSGAPLAGIPSNFLMRDNGAQGSTSGFYLSPTGTGMNEPVDHVWVEGLDFETFLMRGADDVTFKNNDIGPGKTNHWDEKLWVSVGHNGSNYVGNYSTNLVLDGNLIHNFTRDACVSSGCHVECLTFEAENFKIVGNQFLDCDIFGVILSDDAGFSSTGTENLIEGNVIHCCKTTSGYSLALGDTEKGSVVTVRNNEFRGTVTDALGGSLGTIKACGNTGTGGRPSAAWSAAC